MAASKNLGIWMDHAKAHIMELAATPMVTTTIESKIITDEEHSLSRNHNVMYNKEQQQQTAFYKRLMDVIKKYDDVVLFGPTNAKKELANLLKWDNHFRGIKVTVKHADKMSEKQQHAFVREHFLKTLPSLNSGTQIKAKTPKAS